MNPKDRKAGKGTGTRSGSRCVHDFGSRTFNGAGIDTEKLIAENRRKFAKMWGAAVGNGTAVPLKPRNGAPRISGNQNQPRMNTDLHGWDSGIQATNRRTHEALACV